MLLRFNNMVQQTFFDVKSKDLRHQYLKISVRSSQDTLVRNVERSPHGGAL